LHLATFHLIDDTRGGYSRNTATLRDIIRDNDKTVAMIPGALAVAGMHNAMKV
jgi:hypothetical protein